MLAVSRRPPMSPAPTSRADDDEQDRRLQRLALAMEAFLQFQRAGGDRGAFLRANEPLRDLLEPMFDADDTPAAAPVEPFAPGRCFGDYRIVREVGRGGMGVVYEAEQVSLRRRVALKVLPEHRTADARSVARFRREAAAASRLRHPAIVPIHEVGETHGCHYYTMEFVDGRPLHEAMHDDRLGVRADCSRAAEVAEVTARLGEALQHAHDHGLVHRDVKPHNVMIARDGNVRLLDFGLAKDADALSQSRTGEFLGTPHYCSPEQVTGTSAGPASDQFSLGIVLYELLARRRPFDGDTAQLVMRRIELGEFPPVTRMAPATPRDLATICHKALERRPQDRYATVGAFAADLRRFLRIEPILAAPPGPFSRALKWVRRHRAGTVLATAAFVTAIGGPAAYALHLQRTNAAIETERRVLAQAEVLGFRSIEQTLSILGERLEQEPEAGARSQPRLVAVVELCESFLALRADDPGRRTGVARALWLVAGIQNQLGEHEAAIAACRRATALLDTDPDPGPGAHALLRGRLLLRELHARQQLEPTGGDAEFLRAVAHWNQVHDAGGTDGDAAVVNGETLLTRARALADRPDRRRDAERLLQEALTALGRPEVADDDHAHWLRLRCEVLLGHVLLATGRTADALARFEQFVPQLQALPPTPMTGVELAQARLALGTALQRLGRSDAAEATLVAAIAGSETLLREFPAARQLRRTHLHAQAVLGSLRIVRGDHAVAEPSLREALAAAPPADAATHWMDRAVRAEVLGQLATCILMHDDVAAQAPEAVRLFEQASALQQGLVDEHPDHVEFRIELGVACNGLASVANEGRDWATALTWAERAVAAQEQALARMPQNRRARTFLGIHHGHRAFALAGLGRASDVPAAAAAALEHAPSQPAALRLAADAATRAAEASQGDVAEASGALAVRLLARIGELNRAEARRLVADRRFASLQQRADGKALRERLEGP